MSTTHKLIAAGFLALAPLGVFAGEDIVCRQLVPGVQSPMAFVNPDGSRRTPSPEEVAGLLAQEKDRSGIKMEATTLKSGGTRVFFSSKASSETSGKVVATAPIGTGSNKALSNFIINSLDGPGEGVNDPTARAAVGGNTGTTIGAQRANAMQEAALYWGGRLNSTVDIVVEVNWQPQTCNAFGGVLGSAGAPADSDFAGAPRANTLYHDPLANTLAGTDLFPAEADIGANFNSSIDNNPNCLGDGNTFSVDWYYGFDGNPPGSDIDFFDTFKHEMAHGLCFSTYVNVSTGAKPFGLDDAYMLFLFDPTVTPSDWPSMSDGQRATSATNNGNLLWNMATVSAEAATLLSSGTGSGGRVRMYAPNSLQPGSSVSHWDEVLVPDELMEPSADPNPDDTLTQIAFEGMGWTGNLGPSGMENSWTVY